MGFKKNMANKQKNIIVGQIWDIFSFISQDARKLCLKHVGLPVPGLISAPPWGESHQPGSDRTDPVQWKDGLVSAHWAMSWDIGAWWLDSQIADQKTSVQ